jgi:hypothetical protein
VVFAKDFTKTDVNVGFRYVGFRYVGFPCRQDCRQVNRHK